MLLFCHKELSIGTTWHFVSLLLSVVLTAAAGDLRFSCSMDTGDDQGGHLWVYFSTQHKYFPFKWSQKSSQLINLHYWLLKYEYDACHFVTFCSDSRLSIIDLRVTKPKVKCWFRELPIKNSIPVRFSRNKYHNLAKQISFQPSCSFGRLTHSNKCQNIRF